MGIRRSAPDAESFGNLFNLVFWIRDAPCEDKKSSRENGTDHIIGQASLLAALFASVMGLTKTQACNSARGDHRAAVFS